jgi:hypothetical protein
LFEEVKNQIITFNIRNSERMFFKVSPSFYENPSQNPLQESCSGCQIAAPSSSKAFPKTRFDPGKIVPKAAYDMCIFADEKGDQ